MVTAPAGLLDDAIEHGLSVFRVKRWLTVDHTLHLTWLDIMKRDALLEICR